MSARWINLDGMLHFAAGGRECCRILGKRCPRCGAFMHGQPAYGCILEVCEACEAADFNDGPMPATDDCGLIVTVSTGKVDGPKVP